MLLLLALVYNQKGAPLPEACLVATICFWGLVCIPNGISLLPDRLGLLNHQSLQRSDPCPSEPHLHPGVCEKKDKTKAPSLSPNLRNLSRVIHSH